MQGDVPALLEMSNIELLSIIRVMCKKIGKKKTADKKFESQIQHEAENTKCKTNKELQAQSGIGSFSNETNMLDYLNSSKIKLVCQIILIQVTTKK